MKKSIITSILCAGILFLSSCATSISVNVQRPAELDLHGANSISVIPFQTEKPSSLDSNQVVKILKFVFSDRNSTKIDIADYLTNQLTNSLLNSNYMQVIGSDAVLTALENGTEVPADCYLTGYISKFDSDTDFVEYKDEDDDGNVTYTYAYKRKVNVTIVYQVIDSSTSQIICSKSQELRATSSEYSNIDSVPSSYNVIKSELGSLVNQIMRELQPYVETKYLTMLDNKEFKNLMEPAKKMVKEGLIEDAHDAYLDIYNKYDIFEAGYNAALLKEAKGDLDGAESLMQEMIDKFGNKKAISAMSDIRNEKKLAAKLQNQLDSKENNQ